MDNQPLTGNSTLDHVLAVVGALVPLFSAIASWLNSRVRAAQSAGEATSPAMLNAAAALNFLSVNLDKAQQLAALARGKPVATTTNGVVSPAPAAEKPVEVVKPE